MGFTIVLSTLAGLAGGYFLDKYLDTSPLFTLVLFVIGTIAGFYYIIKEAKKLK